MVSRGAPAGSRCRGFGDGRRSGLVGACRLDLGLLCRRRYVSRNRWRCCLRPHRLAKAVVVFLVDWRWHGLSAAVEVESALLRWRHIALAAKINGLTIGDVAVNHARGFGAINGAAAKQERD